jgi:NAD(P)-dependent dehydrogenase (short-subunit alcohol dehydrogenase family)
MEVLLWQGFARQRMPESAPSPLLRSSDRLAGKNAVVFGGGGGKEGIGVGQAAALGYAAAGARVAVVDASRENAERTAERIAGAVVITADVLDEASVAEAIDMAAETFGSIDILHNNVGIPMTGEFTGFSAADWTRGFAINCIGAATTMRLAIEHLLRSRGAIINVSSVASIRHTGINYPIYNASKAALDQLTVAVALEYAGRGIRANAILPGLLDTEMGRSLASPDDLAERDRRSPTGLQGTVWDIANAAVFLASDEARYINGHLLIVDGGLSKRA